MKPTLENDHFQFKLDPSRAVWSLFSPRAGAPFLENARTWVGYRRGRAGYQSLEGWEPHDLRGVKEVPSPHGPALQQRLMIGPDRCGLCFTLTFRLPAVAPLFLWRLTVENQGPQPVYMQRLEMLRAGPQFYGAGPGGNPPSRVGNLQGKPAFFSNGWQSWSFSGAYGAGDIPRRSRLGPLQTPAIYNPGTPRPEERGHFSSDMFGVLGDHGSRMALLAGFLSQRQHFGSLEAWAVPPAPSLRMWANGDGARLDPGATLTTDWACLCYLDREAVDPLGPYLEAVARQHDLPTPRDLRAPQSQAGFPVAEPPTGWCSWYQYSDQAYRGELSAQAVRKNLAAMATLSPEIPLQVCQIDDGFEAQIGDWFEFDPAFPEGVAPLAKEIRSAGHVPGLWLAPFIVHPKSRLAEEHPDWLLRGRFNRPVNAGFLWGAFATALDLTVPQALDYAARTLHTAAHEWGFPYLKLDFLYAAALPGKYEDATKTRAQVLRGGLEALRAAAGDETYLLGCGCPLGSAVGLVDAMRIGADTASRWRPAYRGVEILFKEEPHMPAARLALQNALTRAPLNRRWWVNDPDCLLLRPETHLTREEVESIATLIALSGGSLLLSDDLTRLPAERTRIAQALLPLIGKTPRVLDWFESLEPRRLRLDLENETGEWSLLAYFNWEDEGVELNVNLGEYDLEGDFVGREFWSGRRVRSHRGWLGPLRIAAHGAACLALRPLRAGEPHYLGSDLHISQGLEVSEWRWEPTGAESRGELTFSLERPGRDQGVVALNLPSAPKRVELDGKSLTWRYLGYGDYRFPVRFDRTAEMKIHLSGLTQLPGGALSPEVRNSYL